MFICDDRLLSDGPYICLYHHIHTSVSPVSYKDYASIYSSMLKAFCIKLGAIVDINEVASLRNKFSSTMVVVRYIRSLLELAHRSRHSTISQ